jgi:dihydroorotase
MTAHAGVELYAEAFELMNALDERFTNFMCVNGAKFYGFPPSQENITLVREPWTVDGLFHADEVPPGSAPQELTEAVVPYRFGEKVMWKLVA